MSFVAVKSYSGRRSLQKAHMSQIPFDRHSSVHSSKYSADSGFLEMCRLQFWLAFGQIVTSLRRSSCTHPKIYILIRCTKAKPQLLLVCTGATVRRRRRRCCFCFCCCSCCRCCCRCCCSRRRRRRCVVVASLSRRHRRRFCCVHGSAQRDARSATKTTT